MPSSGTVIHMLCNESGPVPEGARAAVLDRKKIVQGFLRSLWRISARAPAGEAVRDADSDNAPERRS